jgi:protease-4
MIARRRPTRIHPLLALLSLPMAMMLATTGCITLDMGGGGRGEMSETVVYGDGGPKVLMLDIDGEITDSDAAGVLGWVLSEGTVSRVRDQLDLAESKGDIKAIIVRIDSPGGSPTASDAVYRQLVAFKNEHGTPVHAQMMSVAASGGYYVAMAADQISASRTTVTGSIGVIMMGVNLAGLMDKIGVENQTFTSGQFKDAGSFMRPMKKAERKQLQSVVDDLYLQFVDVVDEGRPNLSEEDVMRLADGRIYSAQQALAVGLVDEIAPIEGTIDAVREALGATEIRVVSYHRQRESPSNIYSRSMVQADLKIGSADPVAKLWPRPGFYYLWWPGVH